MKRPLNIIGSGKALPKHCVNSLEIDQKLSIKPGSVERLSGLTQRYFLNDSESADDLVKQAVEAALKNSGTNADDIDCVINASATMRQALPFNAAYTVKLLDTRRSIAAFDVNMTCLSALQALDLAADLTARYPTVLIVSCDIASVGLDWRDFHSSTIFGDGAAALIVRSSENGGILASRFALYPEGYDFCTIPGGGYRHHPARFADDYVQQSYFHMNGKKLHKLVADKMPDFLVQTLAQAGLSMSDIDWVVPHQASRSSLDHIVKRLSIPKAKLVDIFTTHGNQVAASLPTALHTLLTEKPVKSGDKILLAGTSAGVGLGALVWEKP